MKIKYTDTLSIFYFICSLCLIQDFYGKEKILNYLSNSTWINIHWSIWIIPIILTHVIIYYRRKSNKKLLTKFEVFSDYFKPFGILEDDVEIAKITAADFNGKSFDGMAFVPANEDQRLDKFFIAFKLAMEQGSIKISNVGCTDYATWDFFDKDEVCTNYGPGDLIFYSKKYGLVPYKTVN